MPEADEASCTIHPWKREMEEAEKAAGAEAPAVAVSACS